jgi:hypothetical protein
MENNVDLDKTDVYPFCYKIKENCLPCPKKADYIQNEGVSLLARFLATTNNKEKKLKYYDELFYFLQQYGDIYKKLNIELYVNPSTKKVLFPNNQRIQANFNQYLTDIGLDERAPNFVPTEDFEKLKNECIIMYNILLIDKFREIYNDFYISDRLADPDSLKPKEYGIARLINDSSGGKKSKKQKLRKIKTAKNKIKKKSKNLNK